MTQATSENVFVGAVIEKSREKYNVYKVNSTTVWAGKAETKDILRQWKEKPKGLKWLDFMKKNNATKFQITGITIDEKRTENKISPARKEGKNSSGRIKSCCQREIRTLYDAYKNGRSYRHMVQCVCGKNLRIVKIEDDGRLWIGSGLDYIYYDVETKEEEYIRTIGAVAV